MKALSKLSLVVLVAMFNSACGKKEQVLETASPTQLVAEIETKIQEAAPELVVQELTPFVIKAKFCTHIRLSNGHTGQVSLEGDYACAEREVSGVGECDAQSSNGVNEEEGLKLLQELALSNAVLGRILDGDGYSPAAPGIWEKNIGDFKAEVSAYQITSAVCEK